MVTFVKFQKIPCFTSLIYSELKIVFFGKNWVEKTPFYSFFLQKNENISNQTTFREKNR